LPFSTVTTDSFKNNMRSGVRTIARRAALMSVLPWVRPPQPGHGTGIACPQQWKPTESGCVSSLPSGAPNRNLSPLRYAGDRERTFSRLRAYLLAKDATLLEDSQGELLRVRLPTLEISQPGLLEELTFRFLPDEPIVTFRIIAERPYVSQPFCVTPGCIVGNAAQRKRLESIRDEVGLTSIVDPTAVGKWVPIFFNKGIDLSVDDNE